MGSGMMTAMDENNRTKKDGQTGEQAPRTGKTSLSGKIRSSFRVNLFIRLALLTFLLFGVVTVVSQQLSYLSLEEQQAEYEKKIARLNDEINELNDRLNEPYDDEYIEKEARAMLDYHMPDETLYYSSIIK